MIEYFRRKQALSRIVCKKCKNPLTLVGREELNFLTTLKYKCDNCSREVEYSGWGYLLGAFCFTGLLTYAFVGIAVSNGDISGEISNLFRQDIIETIKDLGAFFFVLLIIILFLFSGWSIIKRIRETINGYRER